ncbi:MAG TPA: AzlC family ABC transporter permease [Clostridiaceae bacterium]|nr:AzlC family ABC transporter permease [Clostridiaceae bacterium]
MEKQNSAYKRGLISGIPIALGYFAVALTFGIYAVAGGFTPLQATITSLTNLSSTGQLAGVNILSQLGGYLELATAVFIINLRYMLMSFSLATKVDLKLPTPKRLVISFGITDEIYALASLEKGVLDEHFFFGLMTLPILGWTTGTLVGSSLGPILPPLVSSAFGIAIYCMFIAIIVPPSRGNTKILLVILASITLNLLFIKLPFLSKLAVGWRLTIVSIIIAGIAAMIWPKETVDE